MKIELGPPEAPPVATDPDIDALASAMIPGARYPVRQIYAAYAAAVRAEGREPMGVIGLGKRIGSDGRFRRVHTRAGSAWVRS